MDNTDAVFKEISFLKNEVNFDDLYLYPFNSPSSLFPRFLYGVNSLSRLSRFFDVDIFHVFAPYLYFFPVFNLYDKPIVYTVLSSGEQSIKHINQLNSIDKIIVSNERARDNLLKAGLLNTYLIKPGIKLPNKDYSALNYVEADQPLKILMASAPWTKNQINSKGILSTLQVAKDINVHITFLLRGSFEIEFSSLIKANNLEHRATVVNRRVNIFEVLVKHHVTMLLAQESNIVKAYPHSLIESLIAKRPVIVSDTIAMSDLVKEEGLGEVVSGIEPDSLRIAIVKIQENYHQYVKRLEKFDINIFSSERYVSQTMDVYNEVLK